jgi:hypothetical protein
VQLPVLDEHLSAEIKTPPGEGLEADEILKRIEGDGDDSDSEEESEADTHVCRLLLMCRWPCYRIYHS